MLYMRYKNIILLAPTKRLNRLFIGGFFMLLKIIKYEVSLWNIIIHQNNENRI